MAIVADTPNAGLRGGALASAIDQYATHGDAAVRCFVQRIMCKISVCSPPARTSPLSGHCSLKQKWHEFDRKNNCNSPPHPIKSLFFKKIYIYFYVMQSAAGFSNKRRLSSASRIARSTLVLCILRHRCQSLNQCANGYSMGRWQTIDKSSLSMRVGERSSTDLHMSAQSDVGSVNSTSS